MAETIAKIDFLRRWNEMREDEGVELNDLPQLPDMLLFGGLDLAERIDHTSLFNLNWNGQHLKQYGVAEWAGVKYPEIASDIASLHEKLGYYKIGYDETGNIAVGYLFSQNLEEVMEPIHLTNAIKLDCIRVVNYFKDIGILQLEAGDPVIRQMEDQQKVVTNAGNQRYEHPSGYHDDRFWGLALACYTAVEYIVGIPPAAIVTANEEAEYQDVDTIIEDVMRQYVNKWI